MRPLITVKELPLDFKEWLEIRIASEHITPCAYRER
jgi:hypothetical protein